MYLSKKPWVRIAPFAFPVLAWSAAVASADPVRITVDFRVSAQRSGAHGSAAGKSPNLNMDACRNEPECVGARGSFSLTARVPAQGGQVKDFARGLGADSVSFAWAGTAWNAATSDVTMLVFDPRGALMYWQLAGIPGGLMDMSAAVAPDVFVDPFALLYTRRGVSRVSEGAVVWADVRMAPYSIGGQPPPAAANPIPEPMSMVLVGSGLTGILVRTWRKARHTREA